MIQGLGEDIEINPVEILVLRNVQVVTVSIHDPNPVIITF